MTESMLSSDVTLNVLVVQFSSVIAVCSVRWTMLILVFPPFAEAAISGLMRSAITVMLGAYVAYGQRTTLVESLHGVVLVETIVREALIGLMLGFLASTVFWVAEGAGVYIDNLTGYNNAQVKDPLRQEQSTPTSTMLTQLAIVAFWSLGGMTFLLSAIYESYYWWPIASTTPIAFNVVESFLLSQTDSLMQATAKLAVPIVFLLLLVDFGFGFVTKSAEKLELSSLSQPVKGALAVLMLALLAGLFIDQTRTELSLLHLGEQFRTLMRR